ncbi:hypothetical protein C7450_104443 [Chelatococcus asaccharovorans]|uniref:Uncharacterized protein n=1 Tax=Chelatococcus asaccharovorans TaxID=28210 RepID=A0A2V3UC65_9HYPH|nr:hypothetical protein C7450_104443 [Chelatococcus asaccharovorans]
MICLFEVTRLFDVTCLFDVTWPSGMTGTCERKEHEA